MRQLKITNRITKRESIALDKYLNDISKIDLLTPEDEIELAVRIKQGDQQALDKLTKGNLRFVVSVAKQYQNQGLSLSDLINEGNVGLMKAARRFDETRGFKFISYAVWWIRQSILQAIVEHSRVVRLPLNKVNRNNKINEAYLQFIQINERAPSSSELSDMVELPVEEVEMIIQNFKRHVSFDAPVDGDESSITMLELLPNQTQDTPDKKLMSESLSSEVHAGLSTLSPREREVLVLYYGLDGRSECTLEEVGDNLGLTRERVRQIRDRALRRLRKNYRGDRLKQFLG